MDFNIFLDEEDGYKYYILKLLELKQGSFFSRAQLNEMLGISKYKLERYLEDIESDSKTLDLDISISDNIDGSISIMKLDNILIKKLRLYYLEKSIHYKILKRMMMKKNLTADDLVKDLHMSRSQVYKEIKSLKDKLRIFRVKIDDFKLVGNEIDIRSFLFSFFNEFYSGMVMPFSDDVISKIKKNKAILLAKEEIFPTKVQEYRLELFLGILFIRCDNSFFLDELIASEKDYDIYSYFKFVPENNNSMVKHNIIEIQHLYLFCYTENIIDNKLEFFLKVDVNAEALMLNFLDELITTFSQENLNIELLKNELMRINRKWLYFHYNESTFIFESQRSYFQEIYIKSDIMVREFLSKPTSTKYFAFENEKIKVYYDYLFLMTTQIPIEILEDVVYVCIDFSHGKFYNEFIKQSIESLKNLNIIFESRITNNTQIYISDFILEGILCSQVIWKKPPGPNDWKHFGDLIVKFKREDNYE